MDKTLIQARVETKLKQRLEAEADKRGVDLTSVVIEAIGQYLDHPPVSSAASASLKEELDPLEYDLKEAKLAQLRAKTALINIQKYAVLNLLPPAYAQQAMRYIDVQERALLEDQQADNEAIDPETQTPRRRLGFCELDHDLYSFEAIAECESKGHRLVWSTIRAKKEQASNVQDP